MKRQKSLVSTMVDFQLWEVTEVIISFGVFQAINIILRAGFTARFLFLTMRKSLYIKETVGGVTRHNDRLKKAFNSQKQLQRE